MLDDAHYWAATQFGSADLGDARRTGRLVSTMAAIARAPDESLPRQLGSIAGAKAAVAMAECKDIGATTTADNGAGQIPWVKTPIYLVSQEQMGDFVCKHPYWLKIDEVYKNVPDKKPACQ